MFATDWLRRKGLNEQLLGLLELDSSSGSREAICRVGPTDAGLLELAFREGAVLLTEDQNTLARLGWERGIECKLVRQLLDTEFV